MTLTLPALDEQVRAIPEAHTEIKPGGLVEALIVPYMRPADVIEPIGDRIVEYREQFAAGAFDRAAQAPRRVGYTFTHSHAMPDRMGYGVEFRDSAEGAVGVFQLYEHNRDQAVELITTTHDGLSVTFRSIRPQYGTERDGQLVTRQAVHLISVAATDVPVYADARVLALRARDEQLRAEQEANAARARRYVDSLLYLREHGRELTPAQVVYLAEQGHPAAS